MADQSIAYIRVGDFVKVSITRGNKTTWDNGVIVAKRGLTAFDIQLDSNGKVFKRHLNQLILNTAGGIFQGGSNSLDNQNLTKPQPSINPPSFQTISGEDPDIVTRHGLPAVSQRSRRTHRPPVRFGLDEFIPTR